jgi:ferritin-like metal-binding protein YciE
MLWIEETLAREVLPLLQEHATGLELLDALEQHEEETKQHARTVRLVLDLIGEHGRPEPTTDLPAPDLEHADLGIAESVIQVEHLEIAAYTSLRALANALGEDDIGVRLQEVLEQEQYALELAEKAAAKYLAEHVANARA